MTAVQILLVLEMAGPRIVLCLEGSTSLGVGDMLDFVTIV